VMEATFENDEMKWGLLEYGTASQPGVAAPEGYVHTAGRSHGHFVDHLTEAVVQAIHEGVREPGGVSPSAYPVCNMMRRNC